MTYDYEKEKAKGKQYVSDDWALPKVKRQEGNHGLSSKELRVRQLNPATVTPPFPIPNQNETIVGPTGFPTTNSSQATIVPSSSSSRMPELPPDSYTSSQTTLVTTPNMTTLASTTIASSSPPPFVSSPEPGKDTLPPTVLPIETSLSSSSTPQGSPGIPSPVNATSIPATSPILSLLPAETSLSGSPTPQGSPGIPSSANHARH